MYLLKMSITLGWAPDGAGPETVTNAQSLQLSDAGGTNFAAPGPVLVPGANAPSAANITTAINSMAATLAAGFETATNLAMIQGWATGGD